MYCTGVDLQRTAVDRQAKMHKFEASRTRRWGYFPAGDVFKAFDLISL